MDEMIRIISQYPNGTFLKIVWEYGKSIVEGVIDTIYETDNGLDICEKDYQEFYACAFWIKAVICDWMKMGLRNHQLIEISRERQPTSIELEDGTIIWEK